MKTGCRDNADNGRNGDDSKVKTKVKGGRKLRAFLTPTARKMRHNHHQCQICTEQTNQYHNIITAIGEQEGEQQEHGQERKKGTDLAPQHLCCPCRSKPNEKTPYEC